MEETTMKINLTKSATFIVLNEKLLVVNDSNEQYYFLLNKGSGDIVKCLRSPAAFAAVIANKVDEMNNAIDRLHKVNIPENKIDERELVIELGNFSVNEITDNKKTEGEESLDNRINAFLQRNEVQELITRLRGCNTLKRMVEEIAEYNFDYYNPDAKKIIDSIDTEKTKIIIVDENFFIIENDGQRKYYYVDDNDGHIKHLVHCPSAFAVMVSKKWDYDDNTLEETLANIKVIEEPSSIAGLDFGAELKNYYSVNMMRWDAPIKWDDWMEWREWRNDIDEYLRREDIKQLVKTLQNCKDLKEMVINILVFIRKY